MKVCGIVYKNFGKVYYFNPNNFDLKINDYVIVETEKGEQFGKVVLLEEKKLDFDLKNVIKIATKDDYNKFLKQTKEAKEALEFAKKSAMDLGLDMQFVEATFTFDHKQLLYNFIADDRIDFRELVKLIAAKYHVRIDLHQIGARDKAKEIGGIGPCGRKLCCTSFLNKIDTISINMAKNQNIALNPAKINGSCGRLLCCLAYEDETYTLCKAKLPEVNSTVKYQGKNCKVISNNIFNNTYTIENNGEEIVVELSE